MNTKVYMIIIKGEIKTHQIGACDYNKETQKWDVTFKNGKTYRYAYENVQKLSKPQFVNPNMYKISHNSKELTNISEIRIFSSNGYRYWHVSFENGREADYLESNLVIEECCLKNPKANDVFSYLKELSKLSEIRNSSNGEKVLYKSYEKIGFISDSIALSKYLGIEKKSKRSKKEFIPIFPFGCHNSQYKAVKGAMENQISVIQGPPGTGKTQTILNIIANILMQGKTVQVVSNNNTAIDNVYEKLSSEDCKLDFIVAALGKSENKKSFVENQRETYPDFSDWKIDKDSFTALEIIKEKSIELKNVFDKEEKAALLKQELAQIDIELKHFNNYLKETNVTVYKMPLRKNINSIDLMRLWQRCQDLADKNKKINFFFKIKALFKCGILKWDFYKQDISEIITSFQKYFYDCKRREICNELDEISKFLSKKNSNLIDDMCNDSMKLLKNKLAIKYAKRDKRQVFTEQDLWKNSDCVLEEYPVILSTTFSSRNSLNSNVIYDYIIMDEASQVDLATGALALSCAKNAIIVGDIKQLPNVLPLDVEKKANFIYDSFNLNEGYRYNNSFLQSVLKVIPDVESTLLKEHYRCHPKIINFCNQKFYNGELVIMTKDNGEKDVLTVVKTVEGNHSRGHYSQRQIDVIKNEVIPKYSDDKKQIGIITPYKDQVNALKKEFSDVDVATVHKFQGREKDTIVISTVDDEITDFVDDPYLLNVAVSRAKKKLVLVVSGNEQSPERNISDLIEYIKYNNFEMIESKIYSVFDYLYKQYTVSRNSYLKEHKRISEFDSENLMHTLILEVLEILNYSFMDVLCHFPLNMLIRDPKLLNDDECKYAMNPSTHVDFLIFNKISKKPILAIEVDGFNFHKEGTIQAIRDKRKNHILDLYDIPLLRFSTNGSDEKEILLNRLKELVG